jgi:transaldolase
MTSSVNGEIKLDLQEGNMAADLQREGAESFVKSWKDLLDRIGSKQTALKADG